jgi:hypothetical protein
MSAGRRIRSGIDRDAQRPGPPQHTEGMMHLSSPAQAVQLGEELNTRIEGAIVRPMFFTAR